MRFALVDEIFRSAVERGVFPGAVILAAREGRVVLHRSYGFRALLPKPLPMTGDTLFDLSSLTKPLATTTAMMLLVRDRRLGLDDSVTRVIPSFAQGAKPKVTFRHLLSHTSGLPAWKPYYRELVSSGEQGAPAARFTSKHQEEFWRLLDRERLDGAPGHRVVYSDLGFMLLGRAIEQVSGVPLDEFCRDLIFSPLGLESTFFIDVARPSNRSREHVPFAATELCPWRRRILCGEVHDDNAFVMGGIAGHAGLFSNATDIARFMHCLRECTHDQNSAFLPGSLVRSFLKSSTTVAGAKRALGWDRPSLGHSASGRWFSEDTIGHLGFTGTSLWWDLARDIYVVMLTNRVHPRRDNDGIKTFRPRAHDIVMEALLT